MPSSIVSQQSLGLATDSQSGLVSTTTQMFAGNKTFNGQILTPNRIVFNVSSSLSASNNTQQQYDSIYLNIGSAFSLATSRFTAPITGAYYFEWAAIKIGNILDSVHRQSIRVNGTQALDSRHLRLDEKSTYGSGSCAAILFLNANDYVDIYVYDSTCASYNNRSYEWFHGYLIG
jgi:hypothetical protein